MKPLAMIKCPFCEATTGSNNRKTLAIFGTETFYCYRCQSYGNIKDLGVPLHITPKAQKVKLQELLHYNNSGKRFSVCRERLGSNDKDIFQIKDGEGSLVGHYTRFHSPKRNHIEGEKGFCYREKFLKLGNTYRVVEGVYDCVYPNDIALLGLPSQKQADQLKYYQLILCPDGDVWLNKELLKQWVAHFDKHRNIMIEYIPNNLDPDECPREKRKLIEFSRVKDWCS